MSYGRACVFVCARACVHVSTYTTLTPITHPPPSCLSPHLTHTRRNGAEKFLDTAEMSLAVSIGYDWYVPLEFTYSHICVPLNFIYMTEHRLYMCVSVGRVRGGGAYPPFNKTPCNT